jgi:hypothetical protein
LTKPESARACEPIQRLRHARGEAARRDGMDAQIVDLQVATHPIVGRPRKRVPDGRKLAK